MDDLAPFEPPMEEEIALQERGLTQREAAEVEG